MIKTRFDSTRSEDSLSKIKILKDDDNNVTDVIDAKGRSCFKVYGKFTSPKCITYTLLDNGKNFTIVLVYEKTGGGHKKALVCYMSSGKIDFFDDFVSLTCITDYPNHDRVIIMRAISGQFMYCIFDPLGRKVIGDWYDSIYAVSTQTEYPIIYICGGFGKRNDVILDGGKVILRDSIIINCQYLEDSAIFKYIDDLPKKPLIYIKMYIESKGNKVQSIFDSDGESILDGWYDRLSVIDVNTKLSTKYYIGGEKTENGKQVCDLWAVNHEIKHVIKCKSYTNTNKLCILYTDNNKMNILSPLKDKDFIFDEWVDGNSLEVFDPNTYLVKKNGKKNLVNYNTLQPVFKDFVDDIAILNPPFDSIYKIIAVKYSEKEYGLYNTSYYEPIDFKNKITGVYTDNDGYIFIEMKGKTYLFLGENTHLKYIESTGCVKTDYFTLSSVENGYRIVYDGTVSEIFDGISYIDNLFPVVYKNGKFNLFDLPLNKVVFDEWFDDVDPGESKENERYNKTHKFKVLKNGKWNVLQYKPSENYSIY